ncbi:MAG: LemA family protein [Dehalococcoidales bacterium]|nr:LemA family protein [Dehalococcoidales bacterium]
MPLFVPILVGVVLGIACLIFASFNYYRKRIIDDLPTSKTSGVFIGLAELKGTAESESPFTSYLGEVKCVQYHWEVDEEWRRLVTTTSTDAKGNTHVSTHVETGWTRVGSGGESQPFYIQDDMGIIRVVPEGAKIQGNETFNKTVTPADPLYHGKCGAGAIANSTHHRRFKETAIPLHAMLYVLGQAREREDVVAAEIAKSKNESMFIISTKSEKQISRGYGIWWWVFVVLGLAFALLGGAWRMVITSNSSVVAWEPIMWMGVGYIGALILVWVWTTFNSLIGLRQRVKQGWSQVEVQLKRRYDLIPNLVQTVEGYRQHERETQTMVAELRTQMTATAPGVKGADFKGVAPALRIVGEKYPELKANESFLKLQQALSDTENRIALARDYFNEIATFYNTRLEIIPDRFLAALAGMRQRQLMSAADFERAPVEVKLSS